MEPGRGRHSRTVSATGAEVSHNVIAQRKSDTEMERRRRDQSEKRAESGGLDTIGAEEVTTARLE